MRIILHIIPLVMLLVTFDVLQILFYRGNEVVEDDPCSVTHLPIFKLPHTLKLHTCILVGKNMRLDTGVAYLSTIFPLEVSDHVVK